MQHATDYQQPAATEPPADTAPVYVRYLQEPDEDGLIITQVTVGLKLSFGHFNSAGVEMSATVRPGMTPEATAERLGVRVFKETRRRIQAALEAMEGG